MNKLDFARVLHELANALRDIERYNDDEDTLRRKIRIVANCLMVDAANYLDQVEREIIDPVISKHEHGN